MNLIASILDRFIDKRVIVNCDREPYLNRWFLLRRGERLGIYIHQFVRSDEDRALHDHPWAFLVIPLWRGYIEHSERRCDWCNGTGYGVLVNDCGRCQGTGRIPHQTRVYPLLGTRFRPATYCHRVELIDGKPAWSLFIRFQRTRVWGFWLPAGFVAWNIWWQEKCE